MLNKPSSFIIKHSKDDSVFSLLIQITYKIFSSPYVSCFISIIGTIVIAIFIGNNCYNYSFFIFVGVYIVSLYLSTWANTYKNNKMNNYNNCKKAILSLDKILRSWGLELRKCAKQLHQLDPSANDNSINSTLSATSFQVGAFFVCSSLSEKLFNEKSRDKVYITIYQKIIRKDKTICRMIAYSGNHEPSSYKEEYEIPKKEKIDDQEIEFHTRIFSNNLTDPIVLLNHEQVMNEFKLHEISSEREENIQQYICIPITPSNMDVTFLLQLDTCVKDYFGDSIESVNEYIIENIYPFAQFLYMIYEEARTIEQLRMRVIRNDKEENNKN